MGTVVVLKRVGEAARVYVQPGRDLWWHQAIATASDRCDAEPMDSEDMLYILYTSGTTGKPKGVARSSTERRRDANLL